MIVVQEKVGIITFWRCEDIGVFEIDAIEPSGCGFGHADVKEGEVHGDLSMEAVYVGLERCLKDKVQSTIRKIQSMW